MLAKRILVFSLIFFLTVLSGCRSAVYNQTEANIADASQRVDEAIKKSDDSTKPTPSLVMNEGLYVDKTPISLSKRPAWLRNKIILRGDQLPFSYYSRAIASGGGRNVLTHYQMGINSSMMVSVNYVGTVKGALDLLAAKAGYVYTVNGNNIYWQAFVTKTFDVAFMPGSSDYMVGRDASSVTAASPVSVGGGSSSTNAVVSGIIDDSASSQYSNMRGKLSVWNDLKDSITQMLSPDGKVVVSESTTSVTVRDRPSNVSLISQYIKNLNSSLSKQVLVKVEVLDVQLSNDFNFGINWDAVKRSLGSNFVLNADYGTPVSIVPLVPTTQLSTGTAGLPQYGVQTTGGSTGVTALINALTQQGKVSIVTQPRVVCLNNQVSQIRIVTQKGYIASVQTTAMGTGAGANGANTNNVTSQVTPGRVLTGFTLYLLPKIMNNKIYMQVNADLSTLLKIDTISSQGSGDPNAKSNAQAPLIQVPNIAQKQFNQRAVIGSGDTLILSGFKQVTNQTGAMQLFDLQDLGGQGSTQGNIETVVLITPIILRGNV